jgi:hypothetical protein
MTHELYSIPFIYSLQTLKGGKIETSANTHYIYIYITTTKNEMKYSFNKNIHINI